MVQFEARRCNFEVQLNALDPVLIFIAEDPTLIERHLDD